MPSFEEIDYQPTPLGELILRRRRPVSMPDTWVYEVKLAGRFLMSSLVHDSEEALAALALQRLHGEGLRVLVGGLGLGHTAAAALADTRVDAVDVVERLAAVVAWHERRLVPLAEQLTSDPRCRLITADCFARLVAPPDVGAELYDAVLIDIDDAPESLLDEDHAAFYSSDGLRRARAHLVDDGVLAVWTSLPADPRFLDRLRQAFASAEVEEVGFDNPLLGKPEVNAIYFARA